MNRIAALMFAAALLVESPVRADFFTYSQWAALDEEARVFYVAGAFDVVAGYSTDGDTTVLLHYRACLSRARMSAYQLSENVKTFAATRPKLQAGSVLFAILSYLDELCGPVPKK